MAATAKFAQIAETLRQRIRDGAYPIGSRLPSENELPAEFGVGKQTIVRVMSELLREGMIVRRQGKGTFVARRSAFDQSGQTQVIRVGVVVERPLAELDAETRTSLLLRGIAQGIGMPRDGLSWEKNIETATTARRASITHPAVAHRVDIYTKESEALFASRLDGLIVIPDEQGVAEKIFIRAASEGIPVVVADAGNLQIGSRADSIVADSVSGFRQAVEWLAARSMRRIHFLGIADDGADMLGPYRQSMAEATLTPDDDWIHSCQAKSEAVVAIASEWCESPAARRPQAVICQYDWLARQIEAVFARHDLTIVAIGETVAESAAGPAIVLDAVDLGRTAAATLKLRLSEREERAAARRPVRILVPTLFSAP